MKRKLLALTLTLVLALTACTPSDSGSAETGKDAISSDSASTQKTLFGSKLKPTAEPTYPKAVAFDDYEGRRAVRDQYPVADDVWNSMSDFSARSASLALCDKTENSLYSPLSLWFALAICAESADGETRAALQNALGYDGNLAEAAKAVYNRLYTDNKIGAMKLASSLWVNEKFSVNQDFLTKAADSFYAHSYQCDFSDPITGSAMGTWLDEATGGLLGGQTIATDPETLMTLFSAIYYSDQWIDEFNESDNTIDAFRNADGTSSDVEYMNRTYFSHGWQAGDGWIASGLSLKNGGSMYFVLPDEGVTPGELLSDTETLSEILSRENEGGWGEVVFQIPKFEVNSSLDLKDTVTGLGAGMVFDPLQADFSNLSEEAMGLSSVKQEATLSIDEKGVTAAAYTQIDYAGAAPPNGRAELILDRPFLFFVTFGSAPLFIGTVNQM